MSAVEMRENIKKRQEWIQATIERERRREAEAKAEAAKKPLTLEEVDAMNRRGEKIDFDKYHLESFPEHFVRNIWENTTNQPKEVKLVTCASCGTKVRKRYGNGRCASCLIKGV
jgi:rubrerythrin